MVNTSLENLGLTYIDLYIYHMWDYNTPLYDILDGLNSIVKEGKVRYIGISNCFAWQLAKANALAEKEGFEKFVSVQGHYTPIFREEEREMIPYCRIENIGLTPYSSLASGRLSKMIDEMQSVPEAVQMLEVKLIDIENSKSDSEKKGSGLTSYSNGIESFGYDTSKDSEETLAEKFSTLMKQYLYPEYPELFYRGRWVNRARYSDPSQ